VASDHTRAARARLDVDREQHVPRSVDVHHEHVFIFACARAECRMAEGCTVLMGAQFTELHRFSAFEASEPGRGRTIRPSHEVAGTTSSAQ
jgi:hypothetical protein